MESIFSILNTCLLFKNWLPDLKLYFFSQTSQTNAKDLNYTVTRPPLLYFILMSLTRIEKSILQVKQVKLNGKERKRTEKNDRSIPFTRPPLLYFILMSLTPLPPPTPHLYY